MNAKRGATSIKGGAENKREERRREARVGLGLRLGLGLNRVGLREGI